MLEKYETPWKRPTIKVTCPFDDEVMVITGVDRVGSHEIMVELNNFNRTILVVAEVLKDSMSADDILMLLYEENYEKGLKFYEYKMYCGDVVKAGDIVYHRDNKDFRYVVGYNDFDRFYITPLYYKTKTKFPFHLCSGYYRKEKDKFFE